jgi:unsaturated rhamnogalacturonyl hydrolase
MRYYLYIGFLFLSCSLVAQPADSTRDGAHDGVADNMLIYQRTAGGWPKHIGNEPIDYTKKLSPAERMAFIDDASMNDATIDNDATSKEIRYLAAAFSRTGNKNYLLAIERGIRYLLDMQYENGGFPQFYPDKSLYRSEITYNDNAMVNALNVLDDVALGTNGLEVVYPSLRAPAADAVRRGVACILRTQWKQGGILTTWCAQYDHITLEPARARSYELPSLSGGESVGVVEFLMRLPHPTPEIRLAIRSAVEWFRKVRIEGYRFVTIRDTTQPGGRDRVLQTAPGSTIWARFYDLGNNEPFFCGRDGVRKHSVAEIEHERRVGYAWYGEWPARLLDKEYPAWAEANGNEEQTLRSGSHSASAHGPNIGRMSQSAQTRIVVDASGKGDFRTVQEAINSLSDHSDVPRVIFIRNGVYDEKIFIEKDNIILQGEDKEHTVLTYSLARDAWRCDHRDDWGVATLNLRGSDITLEDLSIQNSYGFDHEADLTIACAADSATHQKKVSREGHQMALRSFSTTRLKVINCNLRAYGGDTVSPWNPAAGQFYFKDCLMEGGVDFYCPRGWALAENCRFVAHDGPACIWHDGSVDPDSKTVLKDCSFSGYDGFKLGRYHRDAQFYLIHCNFAENMADQDIYLVNTANTIQWGRRVYYYDCHKKGKEYKWYADNLNQAPDAPSPEKIDAAWVFKGKWDPTGEGAGSNAHPAADHGADSSWSLKMAATVMDAWKDLGLGAVTDGAPPPKWNYDQGVVWKGMEALWYRTGDARYFRYIQNSIDPLITRDGNILTYKIGDYNLDNILCGRILLMLFKVTGQEKYYKAASLLRQQLRDQPRTHEGSFWHKQRYPRQVWLDGLYMAQPFYAEWGSLFHEDSVFDDITRQFMLVERHTRDPRSGLLYHGWDESRQEKWADKTSGHSPNFWGRAMGWYGMALVDALDYFPASHPGREVLLGILRRYADAIRKVQDPATGLWWDVLDKGGQPGNYPEASASCMFVYTLAKGVRRGYLPASYLETAKKGYSGILDKFVSRGDSGQTALDGTVGVSGLGGEPYRDGSYGYYTGEKIVRNDAKGLGAFLLAANDMELLPGMSLGKGRTVLLDYYFNNEHKKDITDATVRYHYTWEDQANSGFSMFGHVFRQYGMRTDSLPGAPVAAALKKAAIYVIVDPDDEKEVPVPNYPSDRDIQSLYDWVKGGGVLLLMSNDSGNAEFPHFNRLAEAFGIHFNEDSRNKVIGNKFEMGAFTMTAQDGIFKTTRKIYIKEISTLRVHDPAKAHFTEGGDVIMATAKIGKGTVFAVGDPWFYNEYTDGRKLPAEYQNFNAAKDLAKWLIQQAAL